MWPFHKHRWTEVGRQFGYRHWAFDTGFYLQATALTGTSVTCITYQCLCTKTRQVFLSGHVKKEEDVAVPDAFKKAMDTGG